MKAILNIFIAICMLTTSCHTTKTGKRTSLETNLFPVYGITLGKTSIQEIKNNCYKCEEKNCDAETLRLWDHDEDGIIETLYLTHYNKIPDKWIQNHGFKWCLSYSQWFDLLKELGYTVYIEEEPKTAIFQEKESLEAVIRAVSPKEGLELELIFNYGNRDGEGYSVDSPFSIYEINIRLIKN